MSDELHDLLAHAGPRSAVPEHDFVAIHSAAREVFRARYVRRRTGWLLTAAAALLVAFGLTWWGIRVSAPLPVSVARIERVRGTTAFTAGQTFAAGSTIETGAGWLDLRLTGGQLLQIGVDTHAILESSQVVRLELGRVVVDSNDRGPVTVRTRSGEFRPIGTRFEVRVSRDGVTQLRVREGRVQFESLTIGAGEQLVVRSDGKLERSRIGAVPEIEGRTLRAFLDWITDANEWELRFATADAESLSETTVLHGSVDKLTPMEALQTVMLSTGFEYELSGQTLTVRRAD